MTASKTEVKAGKEMSTLGGYQSAKEAAERIGIDDSQIRKLAAGRLPGATKFGNLWLMPENSWPKAFELDRPPRWYQRQSQ